MGNFKEFGKGIFKFIGAIALFFIAGITFFTIKNPNFMGTIKQGMVNLFSKSYLLINYLMHYGKIKVESSVFVFYVFGAMFALTSIMLFVFGVSNIIKAFGMTKINPLFLILGSLILFVLLSFIITSMFKEEINNQQLNNFEVPFVNNATIITQTQNLTADIVLGQNITNITGGY